MQVPGRPGNSPFLASLAAQAALLAVKPQGIIAVPPVGGTFDINHVINAVAGVTSEDLEVVKSAVPTSNAAAAKTPAAAGQAAAGTLNQIVAGATTVGNVIQGIAGGFTDLAQAKTDLTTLVEHATGELQWWGWILKLDATASTALQNLLGNDTGGLATVLGSLIVSPPLAAALTIIKLATTELASIIKGKDTGKGVTLTGYAWLFVEITTN